MKTLKKFLKNEKFILRVKYFVIFPVLLMTLCSFDEDCSSSSEPTGCNGVSVPPDPVFNLSYTQDDNGRGKFYFTCDQWIVLKTIDVQKNSTYSLETINFQFPYLVCEAGEKHVINEYNEMQSGHTWTFTFTGMSKTTGNPFTTTASFLIN